MTNNPITIFLAVCAGIGGGLISTVVLQKHLNKEALKECAISKDMKLITVNSVVGDTYYCIPENYLQ